MMEAEGPAGRPTPTLDFYLRSDKFKQGEKPAPATSWSRDEKADEATRSGAAKSAADQRVKAGEDFAALAKENSETDAAQGGNRFFRAPDGAAVRSGGVCLEPGEISDVVTSSFGFHIIKLIEKKDATVVPLEQVKPRVQEFLTNQKKQEKVDALIKSAKAKAKIEVLV